MSIYKRFLSLLGLAGILISGCGPKAAGTLPTEECVGNTWTYSNNVQTDIAASPDLIISIFRSDTDCAGGCSPYTATIYGDGRLYISDFRAGPVAKQITQDQLQQVVSAFEEANFYAVAPGCGSVSYAAGGAGFLNISVSTEKMDFAIEDGGACAKNYYARYCGLADKVEQILQIP